jgi:1-carboxybiuret hydrolase subunit AtzH-like protein
MLVWIIVVIALMAEPILGYADDAIVPQSQQHQQDIQAITQLLNDEYSAWSRHDLEAYMVPFWQSPRLIYVSEAQIFQGWSEVKAMMQRNYPDKNAMGTAIPESIQVDLLSDDNATTLERWTVRFNRTSVHGISTSSWRKFPEGWRIVEVQSTSIDLPNN